MDCFRLGPGFGDCKLHPAEEGINYTEGGVVQVFASHKNPSSTERCQQTGLEELKAAIMKYHPLQ